MTVKIEVQCEASGAAGQGLDDGFASKALALRHKDLSSGLQNTYKIPAM